MATIVEKIRDLEYNELAVMGVVEKDADLLEIFQDEEGIRMPFNILYSLQKDGKLNDKTKEVLVGLFENIILTKNDLIDKYLRLVNANGEVVEEITKPIAEVVEPIVEVKTVEPKAPKAKATPKPKTTKAKVEPTKEEKATPAKVELPRRHGKKEILKDIQKQGGKPTPIQRLGLALNDLKNTNTNLTAKVVKQMIGGQTHYTDEQCRQLEQLVVTVQRQANEILNPKRKNGK